MRRFTLVSFHAHPDDESLLTGGSLAKASAEGHRVVLVTATSGERGLAGPQDGHGADLAGVRTAELEHAAPALGCARVVHLGYGDSGLHPDRSDRAAFVHVDVRAAAAQLAEVLREEAADVLTIYDPNGGYGHPDHVQVHRVGMAAARLAGTPVVFEATVSAGLFRGVLRALRVLGHALGSSAPLGTAEVYSSGRRITHRISVTEHLAAKRAAMAAHGSQRRTDGPRRSLDYFLALPRPVFALVFGREWFVEHGRHPAMRQKDLFATLRSGSGTEGRAP